VHDDREYFARSLGSESIDGPCEHRLDPEHDIRQLEVPHALELANAPIAIGEYLGRAGAAAAARAAADRLHILVDEGRGRRRTAGEEDSRNGQGRQNLFALTLFSLYALRAVGDWC